MINKIISQYRILEKQGEGGMGVVYKAEDTKLKRLVALKFLPRELIKDQEAKDRFFTEAQSAAAINHSNIVTVYDINEHDDQVYIAMELVEGKNLKQKIISSPLEIDEVLNIAKQIARGLQEAHKKEIIHRDIKSANIMISDSGQVKILDFGLARLKNQTGVTKVGTTLGTTAYMSPEQTQGTDVDHRSDIWSLGVVLYELLTEETPFKGDYEQAVIYSILNEEPLPISAHRSDIPEELNRIINKTLMKNPDERFQSASSLLEAVRKIKEDSAPEGSPSKSNTTTQLASRGPGRTIFVALSLLLSIVLIWLFIQWQSNSEVKSEDLKLTTVNKNVSISKRKMIVVLPFKNLGPPEDEYFADGITEEVTSRLARLKGLGVIAQISAKQYKNTDKSPQIIGKELGVDYLIEGKIRWQRSPGKPNRVRITPQLIKTSDATHVWAEVYEKNLTDIFIIQAFIAEQVAASLNITLLEGQRKSLAVKPTENMEAYNYYLRGNSILNKDQAKSTFMEAELMYKKAIELDPSFAEPWAKISSVHSNIFWFYYDRTDQRILKAKNAVERAFKLKPGLPQAYKAMGDYYYHGKLEYDHALEQYEYARKGLGENSGLYAFIGYVKRRQGKWKEAADFQTKAFELSPRSATIVRNLVQTLMLMRNYPQAEQLFDSTNSFNHTNPYIYIEKLQHILLWKGDTDSGISILKDASKINFLLDDSHFIQTELFFYLCNKNYQKALSRLSKYTRESIDNQLFYAPKVLVAAFLHKLLGKSDLSQSEYRQADRFLKDRLMKFPTDSRLHSSRGIALAGLGEKDKAVKEGKLGVKLMPIKKDAFRGFYRAIDLAHIYATVGENKKAIDQIEYLLSIPGYISIALLRIDPRWDPLRKHPRFIKLLKKGKQYSYIHNDK